LAGVFVPNRSTTGEVIMTNQHTLLLRARRKGGLRLSWELEEPRGPKGLPPLIRGPRGTKTRLPGYTLYPKVPWSTACRVRVIMTTARCAPRETETATSSRISSLQPSERDPIAFFTSVMRSPESADFWYKSRQLKTMICSSSEVLVCAWVAGNDA